MIAIDGSGSVREYGVEVLASCDGMLLPRYQTEHYVGTAVEIGIVLFGNCVIMPGGKSVSPAISAHALSFDMPSVRACPSRRDSPTWPKLLLWRKRDPDHKPNSQ